MVAAVLCYTPTSVRAPDAHLRPGYIRCSIGTSDPYAVMRVGPCGSKFEEKPEETERLTCTVFGASPQSPTTGRHCGSRCLTTNDAIMMIPWTCVCVWSLILDV